jgi:hypothetical protein
LSDDQLALEERRKHFTLDLFPRQVTQLCRWTAAAHGA